MAHKGLLRTVAPPRRAFDFNCGCTHLLLFTQRLNCPVWNLVHERCCFLFSSFLMPSPPPFPLLKACDTLNSVIQLKWKLRFLKTNDEGTIEGPALRPWGGSSEAGPSLTLCWASYSGAARQLDYKVTVNNPFQLHQAKLHVVFICVCIVFCLLHFATMWSVRWLVVE